MRSARLLIAAAWLLVSHSAVVCAQDATRNAPSAGAKAPAGPFLVKPYLQLGHSPRQAPWSCSGTPATQTPPGRSSTDPGPSLPGNRLRLPRPVGLPSRESSRTGFIARSCPASSPVARFIIVCARGMRSSSRPRAVLPSALNQAYRFVAFGDCGANTTEQKALAQRAFQEKPDFVMITGDIVYARGRVSEYRDNFWPVYNADEASPGVGAPLLRSSLFVAAAGNHDIATRDLERFPDGLAYFLYWEQPLNGPPGEEGSAYVPKLSGPDASKQAFLEPAGDAYPRMANFSFDYGNAHWTVIDSNPYVDWTDKGLRAWVERDLASAHGATWRFVAFHHPGFSSSREHYEQQSMRKLADVFEAGKVDVVWSGHVHNYQRSYPLHFVPGPDGDDKPLIGKDGKPITKGALLPGRWRLDKSYRRRRQNPCRRRDLPGHRRRRPAPLQPRAAGRSGLVAVVHPQVHLENPLADRRRRRRPDPHRAPALGRRPGARPLRRDQVKLHSTDAAPLPAAAGKRSGMLHELLRLFLGQPLSDG